jgi:hypothetical protein
MTITIAGKSAHQEEHLRSSDFITDIVIGMSVCFCYSYNYLSVPVRLFQKQSTGQPPLKGAFKVTLTGITAATAAFLIAQQSIIYFEDLR